MPDSLTALEQLTQGTFIFAFFSMVAGSAFFFSQKNELSGGYRSSTAISGVITLVAALTYFYMKDIYREAALSDTERFPTVYRYIDWFITVPLMLVKFPVLLGLGARGASFMIRLVIVSLVMLVTAFIGEITIGNNAMHYGFYGVSVLAWIYIIYSLGSALSDLPDHVTEAKRVAIRRMFFFILIGWIIYPIGYLMPTFGVAPDYRELLYNIGDVINKVGLGLVIVVGAVAERRVRDA